MPLKSAEEHEASVSWVEVVAGDAVGDSEGGDEGGVPTDIWRVGESFYVLSKKESTNRMPLSP